MDDDLETDLVTDLAHSNVPGNIYYCDNWHDTNKTIDRAYDTALPHKKEKPIYRINIISTTTTTFSNLPTILLAVLLVAASIGLMVFAYLLLEGYRF